MKPTVLRTTRSRVIAPMNGIPADVACPWCGGYVRGHQWIGSTNCSITTVDPAYSRDDFPVGPPGSIAFRMERHHPEETRDDGTTIPEMWTGSGGFFPDLDSLIEDFRWQWERDYPLPRRIELRPSPRA